MERRLPNTRDSTDRRAARGALMTDHLTCNTTHRLVSFIGTVHRQTDRRSCLVWLVPLVGAAPATAAAAPALLAALVTCYNESHDILGPHTP
ncbi:unnamed protein product [Danaus chrysippus]|uniref:(African queen) hypothetical protein n=1 Tax=Danaus chrysippus TaxID=151541 RepID=A0A8J2VVR4_9NEOP|nr:unnamed protein product [Danaus chrysippus]